MSACLPSQLTAPTKPAARPLLLLLPLPSPAAAQRVRKRRERREGRRRHPGLRAAPGAKSRRETGAAQAHPRAGGGSGHGEPPLTQTPSGLGGPHLRYACGNAPAGAKPEPEVRGCTFPPATALPVRCSSRWLLGSAARHSQRGTQPPRDGAGCLWGPGPVLWLCTLILLPADEQSPPCLLGTTGTAAACCCLGDSCQNCLGPREVISN